MTIEIYSFHVKIKETTLKTIEKEIVALSHLGRRISRVEIFLTEDPATVKENKICRIRLDIIGDTLYVHRNADSFEKAAGDAIKVLKKHLSQKVEYKNKPADKIINTLKV
jgi:hypothetical protein